MSVIWSSGIALGLAAGVDYLVGDPWGWPHPVQVMGRVITLGTQPALALALPAWVERIWGVGLGLILVVGSGLVGWGLVDWAQRFSAVLALALTVVVLASCLAGRSLRRAAEEVLAPLAQGNLDLARERLALYVGRDTADLEEPEILRAVLETVSENATDGVLAPLFYGVLGAMVPGLGAVPLALAYKAASTLDSMVGYRHSPYTHLGWFSARLEDGLTWLPCRLTVITIALLSGQPRRVWRICRRDAPADPSPNAGWSEAAYAAALGVQLGGVNVYRGVVKAKPYLGDARHPITPDQIGQALTLTRRAVLLWLGVALALGYGVRGLTGVAMP
jgi:adenosylcobinamide-phosphate synthase